MGLAHTILRVSKFTAFMFILSAAQNTSGGRLLHYGQPHPTAECDAIPSDPHHLSLRCSEAFLPTPLLSLHIDSGVCCDRLAFLINARHRDSRPLYCRYSALMAILLIGTTGNSFSFYNLLNGECVPISCQPSLLTMGFTGFQPLIYQHLEHILSLFSVIRAIRIT